MGSLGRLGRLITLCSLALLTTGLILAVPAGAAGGPTLTVTPSKGLIDPTGDGQFVRLDWTGLPPDLPPYVRQCVANPKNVHDCSQTGLSGPGLITPGNPTPDGSGSAIVQLQVGLVNGTTSGAETHDSFICDYLHSCSMLLFVDDLAENVHEAVKVPITFAFPPSACPTAAGAPAGGSGASAAFRAMLAWEAVTCRHPYDLLLQYTLQSSQIGGADFASGSSSFGIVETQLPDLQAGILEGKGVPYGYAPLTGSALVFGIHLYDRVTDQLVTDIKLTPELIVELFTGQIGWNDPAILALNPQYVDVNGIGTLPNLAKPVARGDASEDTLQFSTWAWRRARDAWIHAGDGLPNVDHNPFEDGPTTLFPSVAAGKPQLVQGARAAAREVARPSQDPGHEFGYIGYMDSSWAATYGLTTVQVLNAGGRFVAPTPHAIEAGISHMQIDENGVTRVADYNSDDPAAYPLPTLNYMLVHQSETETFTAEQGSTVRNFLEYVAGPGQDALPGGYVPLNRGLVKLTSAAAATIPKAVTGGTAVPPAGPGVPSTVDPPTSGPTGTVGPSTPTPSAAALPVERGPLIPPTSLVASPTRVVVPGLLGVGLGGLILGPVLSWEDRRRRRRPERPQRTIFRRTGRHAVRGPSTGEAE